MTPGFAFTTLKFLCSLLIGPISQSVILHLSGKACQGQNTILLGSFVSYGENEEL
jgi:hypothetical protein